MALNTDPGVIEVRSPAGGELLASVPVLDSAAVAGLAARARAAQPQWAALSFEARAKVLSRLQRWLLEHADRVIETIVS